MERLFSYTTWHEELVLSAETGYGRMPWNVLEKPLASLLCRSFERALKRALVCHGSSRRFNVGPMHGRRRLTNLKR